MKKVIVIGGGAAGFFAAINYKKKAPRAEVTILEQSVKLLHKVKISGGGRCNVTHACYEPEVLVQSYPRGGQALLAPFYRFQPQDMINWLAAHNIKTHTEADGRIFPESNDSQTIINCFKNEAHRSGVRIETQKSVVALIPLEGGKSQAQWQLKLRDGEVREADAIVVATGSNTQVWKWLEKLGLKIVKPVPSLFTFNIKDSRLESLAGVAMPQAEVKPRGLPIEAQQGALLITHWGLSAPAILRLSAWGARTLAEKNYEFDISVNWIQQSKKNLLTTLKQLRETHHKKKVSAHSFFDVPSRLWKKLIEHAQIPEIKRWAQVSNKELEALARELCEAHFKVKGKSTFKEEFVTAGGIDLSEIDFDTMESKKYKGLYFCGEVLDIDAITGGFNFQAAWTTAWIVAESL
ncbi:MAG: NAD(P)/FAD-dependent oxidoreductase [Bernardetiaceae bacterium]|nr:NAD(P)/FAD-dependent oxidoreductase [Bernardetiaceae bacterium]